MKLYTHISVLLSFLPVTSWKIESPDFKFRFISLSTFFALIQILIALSGFTQFLRKATHSTKVSTSLLGNVSVAAIYTSASSIRVLFLIRYHSLIVIFKFMNRNTIRTETKPASANFTNKRVFVLGCLVVVAVSDMLRRMILKLEMRMNYAMTHAQGSYTLAEVMYTALQCVQNMMVWTAVPFSVSLVSFCSFNFLNEYGRLCAIICDKWCQASNPKPTKTLSDAVENAVSLARDYRLFRRAHSEFRQLTNLYSLFVVILSFFNLIQLMAYITDISAIQGNYWYVCMALMSTLVYIFILAYIGNLNEATVKVLREKLNNAYKGCKGPKANEIRLMRLTEWLDWNPELHAGGIVNINYGLIPTAFGVLLTYYVCVFQLQRSEQNL